jgi:hypothetical protein
MLVADTRGRVCHATRKLSELLGRSVEQLKGNGADHALSSLLPEPFGQLHRSLAQVRAARAAASANVLVAICSLVHVTNNLLCYTFSPAVLPFKHSTRTQLPQWVGPAAEPHRCSGPA